MMTIHQLMVEWDVDLLLCTQRMLPRAAAAAAYRSCAWAADTARRRMVKQHTRAIEHSMCNHMLTLLIAAWINTLKIHGATCELNQRW